MRANTLGRAHRLIVAIEGIVATVTSVALFAIMVIVFVDVGLRYAFNAPLGWSYDLISMYLMAGLFLLALSGTLRDNHHVRVDILARHAPPRLRLLLELIGYVLTAAVMAAIVWQGAVRTWTGMQAGDVVVGAIAWPTWVSAMLVPIGVGLLVVRLLFGIASLSVALATGQRHAVGVIDSEAPGEL